jgi:hypothetical protein
VTSQPRIDGSAGGIWHASAPSKGGGD